MEWFGELLKDKVSVWIVRIFLLLAAPAFLYLLILTIVRIQKNKHVKIWGFEWNKTEDTPAAQKQQDLISSHDSGTTQVTSGQESPIMTGHGDYKPAPTHISGKNINTGTNNGHIGDVNTIKIPQRHFKESDGIQFRQQFDVDNRIEVVYHGQDVESSSFATEIYTTLKQLGYKNIDLGYGILVPGTQVKDPSKAWVDISQPGRIIISVFPQDNTLKANPQ